jgi:polygalacturonase
MNIAEKLLEVDANTDRVDALNNELQTILNGGDTSGKSYYDDIWDAIQSKGAKEDYSYLFMGDSWNDNSFKPKYDIKPTTLYSAFNRSTVTSFKQTFKNYGVKLDLSKCTNIGYAFFNSTTKEVPEIDARLCSGTLYHVFSGCSNLVTIDKIILSNDGTLGFQSVFDRCGSLENIIFEGVIGKNGLGFGWSTKLSKNSITSIINALSSSTSGLSITLSKTAVNNAFTTSEWEALVSTKSNWTISLV